MIAPAMNHLDIELEFLDETSAAIFEEEILVDERYPIPEEGNRVSINGKILKVYSKSITYLLPSEEGFPDVRVTLRCETITTGK